MHLHNQIQPFDRENFVNHDGLLTDILEFANGGAGGPKVAIISGGAGVGKSAFAHVTADELRDTYSDVRLIARLDIDLEAPGLVSDNLKDFLIALGVGRDDIPERTEARASAFRSLTSNRRVLLIIDGATTTAQVRSLLPGGDSLVIVTEARELNTLGPSVPTRFFAMEPLGVEAARGLLARLVGAERIAAEPDAVDRIIQLCCGLPVALCVVGSMLARPPVRLIARTLRVLENAESRLAALSRDDLSVSAVFSAAYELLNNSAKACYRALGLPSGTGEISLGALTAAVGWPDAEDVRDAMDGLVAARFVAEAGPDRYRVSELIRLHAGTVARVDFPAEYEAGTQRLLDHYFQRTADAESLAPQRPWRATFYPDIANTEAFEDKASAWHWLETERLNIRAAVEYAYSVQDWQRVQQWCVLLWQFYESGKYADDLLATHPLGIDAAEKTGSVAVRSLLLTQTGFGHNFRGDTDGALRAFEEATRIGATVAVRQLEATGLEGYGLALIEGGDEQRAREALRRNLKLARKIKDDRRIALACLHCAKAEAPREALALLAEADTLFAPLNEPVNMAKIALWRAIKLTEAGGPFDTARTALDGALATMNAQGRPFDRFQVLAAFGDLEAAEGNLAEARENYAEALAGYTNGAFTAQAERLRHRLARLGPERQR
ncbi:MAG TPA: NB-ARC domain-containing protein [Pseudonocardiaceae bacterium]|nr:NB-ARC domain-containing protein [Pseudonocardiaceae bacterium]